MEADDPKIVRDGDLLGIGVRAGGLSRSYQGKGLSGHLGRGLQGKKETYW